jgi:hypothetical protein
MYKIPIPKAKYVLAFGLKNIGKYDLNLKLC